MGCHPGSLRCPWHVHACHVYHRAPLFTLSPPGTIVDSDTSLATGRQCRCVFLGGRWNPHFPSKFTESVTEYLLEDSVIHVRLLGQRWIYPGFGHTAVDLHLQHLWKTRSFLLGFRRVPVLHRLEERFCKPALHETSVFRFLLVIWMTPFRCKGARLAPSPAALGLVRSKAAKTGVKVETLNGTATKISTASRAHQPISVRPVCCVNVFRR